MTWFNIDDNFYDHPKVVALKASPLFAEAVGLWALAGCWCARHLTDGYVPNFQVKQLGFREKVADALVRCGLWKKSLQGYHFHHWSEWQPTRAEVERRRKKTREKVAGWRARQRSEVEVGNQVTIAFGNPVTDPVCNRVRNPAPLHSTPLHSEREIATTFSTAGVDRADHALEPHAPAPFDAHSWTAERQAVAFRQLWERRMRAAPSMGGRHVGQFHAQVVRAAELQGIDPAVLFARTLSEWLSRESLTSVELQAPYACFQQAFGRLAVPLAERSGRDVTRGFAEPAPDSAWSGRAEDVDDLFGPLEPERPRGATSAPRGGALRLIPNPEASGPPERPDGVFS